MTASASSPRSTPWRPLSFSGLLDGLSGRVTMYRLVLLGLLATVLVALVEGATGLIAYSPLSIVVCGAAALLATFVSNRLIALVFRVRPHSESSVVTALILLFLFQPSLTVVGIAGVALAGVVASASKYLLAVRGRHVVNPAAIAAVVLSVALPAAFPGWWVGSPTMLPIVAVAAFVILHRTRKLSMGIVFVVVAGAGVTLSAMSFGTSFSSAASNALLSSPVVFFAGFMLSEPLTLPPRRWQQLVLAVVVGVLFALPFHFGPLYGTYELALVVGNVLAFFVGQRRGVRLEFVGKRQLTPSSWEVSFRPRHPLRFRAGQYMELSLPHGHADVRGQRRVFSIVSAPHETDVVRFAITARASLSTFKARLLDLAPGETVSATVVGGDFVLPRQPAPLLLVSGGIGITPFLSQLGEIAARANRVGGPTGVVAGHSPDVVMVHSASSSNELALLDEVTLGAARGLVVAPEPPASLPRGWSYLGPAPLTRAMIESAVGDADLRRAYVSGSPRFVASVRPVLHAAGVRRTTTDAFTGY